ncbi:MAG: peptidase S8, partial [Flavobacteriaceae bacterium]|nr:peptidase S8 [Flavobacteriaceae bacterium]
MIKRKLLLGLGLSIILASCSTTKNIHNIAVPEGSTTAITIPAKKGTMTKEEIQKWPHADITTDSIPGMSLAKAYLFVADKKATTVIVAVIDSGIDINHEDLKDNIWINSDEIAGNNKDDDNNGYIDDIHGWNFLGGEGTSTPEQLEITRIYKKLNAKYGNKTADQIPDNDKTEYAYYQKVKKDFEKRIEKATGSYEYYQKTKKYLATANEEAIKKFGKENYTIADLNTLDEADRSPILMQIIGNGGTVAEVQKQLD